MLKLYNNGIISSNVGSGDIKGALALIAPRLAAFHNIPVLTQAKLTSIVPLLIGYEHK